MELERDFKEMLSCLNARHVEFLVVGSFALAFHGKPRLTGDIDLLVHPTPENGARVMQALQDFGMALPGLSAADFEKPGQVVQLGVPPVRIDLVTSITGVSWEQVSQGGVDGTLGGVSVRYIGLHEFILNKRATGRPKDLGDIDGLEG